MPAAADPESLLASISALIISGEAWADPVPPPSPTRPGVAKPLEAAGQGPGPAAAVLPVITLAVTAPAVITPAVITPAVITPAVSALQDLVAAVASETDRLPAAYVPVLAPPLPEPAAIGRVSLGFRDGSTTQLDPGCEQAAALEELALLLSLRD